MRVLFIGTGEIGLPTLHWLLASASHQLVGVITQPDKPVGRAQRIEPPPIKAALGNSQIAVLQPGRIKDEQVAGAIRQLAPEVIVVMAYGQILPRAVLEIPRRACLNLHASLLPRHRGAAPVQMAIAAGDDETGITVMHMDEGPDTGDIMLQTRIPIAPDETGGSLHEKLAAIAPAALEDALDQLQSGNAPRLAQDSTRATYAPKLEREHGRIDWSRSAQEIERQIRAFNPWPSSFTLLGAATGDRRKLKILRATVADEAHLQPKEIMITKEAIIVGAFDGALRLEEVQLEGRKQLPTAEFLRGNSWIRDAVIEL